MFKWTLRSFLARVRRRRAEALETPVLLPYEPEEFDPVTVTRAVGLLRLQWQVFLDQEMSFETFAQLVRREDEVLETVMESTFERQKDRLVDVLRSSGKVSFSPDVMSDYSSEKEAYEDVVKVLMGIDRYHAKEKLLIGNWDLKRYFALTADFVSGYSSYEELIADTVRGLRTVESKRHDPAWVDRVLEKMQLTWRERTKFINQELATAMSELTHEYLVWLHHHPNAVENIAWPAFERLVAEILSSRGFKVELTARVRNRSADIIAISTDSLGIETKYLIECKCYDDRHRIGMDIVNAVLGAKARERADHALLVTTSSFTSDVRESESGLRDLRLTLRDGDAVQEWLVELKPAYVSGAFLQPGWRLGE
jgi:hypothetical protein